MENFPMSIFDNSYTPALFDDLAPTAPAPYDFYQTHDTSSDLQNLSGTNVQSAPATLMDYSRFLDAQSVELGLNIDAGMGEGPGFNWDMGEWHSEMGTDAVGTSANMQMTPSHENVDHDTDLSN
jgi:hypothetical protein